MPANAAQLRYPAGRVLLGRTKLAYVHLRNLISDAKRDRTARVDGYVAIWLPDEFLLLFLAEGEVINAVRVSGKGAEPTSITSALSKVPAEPEFGEIAFYAAPPELLTCMYRTLVTAPTAWPEGLVAGDPRQLFPHLRSSSFSGVIEVINRDTVNFLVLRDGLIEQTYLVDDTTGGRTEQLARLFGPTTPKPRARVAQWPGPLVMPAQAPAALVAAYRELVDRLYAELGSYGVPVPSAVGERVRDALLSRHPALRKFDAAAKPDDPADDQEDVTAAVAAWVTDTIRESLDGDEDAAASVVKAAARERRHMLHAAGFLSRLPWTIEW